MNFWEGLKLTFYIIGGISGGVFTVWRVWGKAKWLHWKKNKDALKALIDYNIDGKFKLILDRQAEILGEVTTNGGKSLKDLAFKILRNQAITTGRLDVMLYLDDTPTFKCDMEGNCFFVNVAWLQLLGFNDPEEAYGMGWLRAIHPPDKEKVRKDFQDAIKSETQFVSEINKMNIATKSVIPVKMMTKIVRDDNDEAVEIVGQLKLK
ncbi:MAG TPA: PAS domain-containing protein [Chitinophagaceae bacterium]|nr:PAS domain-containing protein [Chitinophagaceae bacterium]